MHRFKIGTIPRNIARAVSICSALSGLAHAQTAPTSDELLGTISSELPSFIQVSDLILSAPSVSESRGYKRLIYDFDIAISAAEQLYSEIREVGPFAVIIPTMKQGATLRLTGLLDLTSNGETWIAGINLGEGLEKFGKPIDRFGQPALVSGDPEAEARLALMRNEAGAAELEELRQEIDATVVALRYEGDALLIAERERGAARLLAIIAEHATKRGELITRQRQQISELETGLASERQSLNRQVASAEGIRQLQARLADTLQEIAANEAASIRVFADMRNQRVRLLETLPTEWVGIVHCTDDANPLSANSTTLEIEFDRVLASGFRAKFFANGRSHQQSGAVTILNETISFPLRLKFSPPDLSGYNEALLPDGFTLELAANGQMRGSEVMMVRWNRNEPSPSTCTFNLSG